MDAKLNISLVHRLMPACGIDSTSEMSRRTGIERTYLSRILRGQRPAQPSQVLAIGRVLRVPPIDLLTVSDTAAFEEYLTSDLPEAS